jgi:hypothetical protein
VSRCSFCGDPAESELAGHPICGDCDQVLAELLEDMAAQRPAITESEVHELLDQVDELFWADDTSAAIASLPTSEQSS